MLAIVDDSFPWIMSGFRYWENYEFWNIDKDVLFFSFRRMNDPFPAKVYPVAAIKEYPVTDIYCVFLSLTLSILDYPGEILGRHPCWLHLPRFIKTRWRHGLSKLIQDKGISLHTTIYPGGGYQENCMNQVRDGLRFIKDHPNVKNVFTNLSPVQEIIPWAYWIPGIVNVDFYQYAPRTKSNEIHLLFVAFNQKSKGFGYLIEAFNRLDPRKFQLHIVGNWEEQLSLIKHNNYWYYGLLLPEQLREVYYKCHIIISPSCHEAETLTYTGFPPIRREYVTVDGFPTTAAADAMSTGCCLVSTNLRKDYRALTPGLDYFEIEQKSSEDIVRVLEHLYQNQDEMLAVATRGAGKIREFFDVKKNVRFKYNVIKGLNK